MKLTRELLAVYGIYSIAIQGYKGDLREEFYFRHPDETDPYRFELIHSGTPKSFNKAFAEHIYLLHSNPGKVSKKSIMRLAEASNSLDAALSGKMFSYPEVISRLSAAT